MTRFRFEVHDFAADFAADNAAAFAAKKFSVKEMLAPGVSIDPDPLPKTPTLPRVPTLLRILVQFRAEPNASVLV
jgi:hypothetical protein